MNRITQLRGALPRPVRRPVDFVWNRGRDALYYLRGKNILRRYAAHHRHARQVFEHEGNRSEPATRSVRAIGVRVVRPGASDNLIRLPDNYEHLVARLAA